MSKQTAALKNETNRERYAITLKVANVIHSQVWDAREPMYLGYRVPWKVERNPKDGKIRLKHKNGTEFEVPEALYQNDQELELKEPTNKTGTPILLRMRKFLAPPPAFQCQEIKGEYFVFVSSGNWVFSSEALKDTFSGMKSGRSVFELTRSGDQYRISLKSSDTLVHAQEGLKLVSEGNVYVIRETDLGKVSLTHEHITWHFAKLDRAATSITNQDILKLPEPDSDTRRFRDTFKKTTLLLLLLLLATWIGHHFFTKEEEPEKEVQVARIYLPKQLKLTQPAAAPTGGIGGEEENVTEKNSGKKDEVGTDVGSKTLPEPTKTKQIVKSPDQATKPATAQVAARPRQSQAIEQAKKLENSFGSLLKAVPSSILGSTGGLKANSGRKSATDVWGSKTGPAPGEAIGALASGQENVRVSYTGAGPGSGGGAGAGGYGAGIGPGPGGAGGKGGSFVSITPTSDALAMEDDSGLSRREVWEVINRHASEIQNCYQRSLIRRPDLEGRLVIGFTIGRDGMVIQHAVKNTTVADPILGQCVVGRLTTWRFPRPRGNVDVKVGYPFVFKRL